MIVILAFSAVRNVGKVAKIRSEIQKEKDKVAKIDKENKELETQVAKTQGEDFIEKELRDKLGLVKQGEVIVVLPDPEIVRKLAPRTPDEPQTLPDPNWKKWLKLFI